MGGARAARATRSLARARVSVAGYTLKGEGVRLCASGSPAYCYYWRILITRLLLLVLLQRKDVRDNTRLIQ